MAFNRFEQSLVDQYTNAQFPDLPPEPEQPMPADGVQLAMGGNAARRSDAPLSDVPIALWDTLAGALRGTVAQTLGLPGDVESLVRMLTGGKQVLPTTERMSEIMPPVVPPSAPGAEMRQKTAEVAGKFGEFNPVMGAPEAVKLGVKGVKAVAPMIPKNVPVGASTDVVGGGTQAMLQAGKATAPVSDIGFYSAVEDAALNIQRKSGSGQAMLNDITKAANVKADEIKWIGLDDFLKGKKNVTKEEVQQFIAQNKVDVQEVQLTDVKAAPVSTENITDYFDETLTPNGDEARGIFNMSFTERGASEPTSFTAYEMKGGSVQLYDNRGNFIDEYRTLADARQHVVNESEFSASQAESKAKFGTYTLPGGENYREILLTLPAKERLVETQIPAAKQKPTVFAASNGKFELLDEMGETFATYNTKAEAEQAATDWAAPFTKKETVKDKEYQSSHWDQPNVLAHIRVNDRVDADGKKMLLVEEVQSDWHQAGRDSGYATKLMTDEERKRFDEFVALDRERPLTAEERLEYQPLADKRVKEMTLQREGVPDAPMKDTWYQLALKRVLKYAADNGYERVGLTTGARQAERYDLSKQVKSLMYFKRDDGSYHLQANLDVPGGESHVMGENIRPEDLDRYVGKDTAKKILEGVGIADENGSVRGKPVGILTGTNLQVGGEGMKKYYDEVYPQFLAKYGKKWGAKVGETYLPIYDDKTQKSGAETIRYVDITPQMRESVGKGQPLFTATGLGTGTAATMQDKEQK